MFVLIKERNIYNHGTKEVWDNEHHFIAIEIKIWWWHVMKWRICKWVAKEKLDLI
jgi:hypothetical protein